MLNWAFKPALVRQDVDMKLLEEKKKNICSEDLVYSEVVLNDLVD